MTENSNLHPFREHQKYVAHMPSAFFLYEILYKYPLLVKGT